MIVPYSCRGRLAAVARHRRLARNEELQFRCRVPALAKDGRSKNKAKTAITIDNSAPAGLSGSGLGLSLGMVYLFTNRTVQ